MMVTRPARLHPQLVEDGSAFGSNLAGTGRAGLSGGSGYCDNGRSTSTIRSDRQLSAYVPVLPGAHRTRSITRPADDTGAGKSRSARRGTPIAYTGEPRRTSLA